MITTTREYRLVKTGGLYYPQVREIKCEKFLHGTGTVTSAVTEWQRINVNVVGTFDYHFRLSPDGHYSQGHSEVYASQIIEQYKIYGERNNERNNTEIEIIPIE